MFETPNARDVEAQPRPQPTVPYPPSVEEQLKPTTTTSMSSKGISGVPEEGGESKSTLIKYAYSMDWGTQLFLISFFSLMVMIVSAQLCGDLTPNACFATMGYQVAVGAVSFVIAFVASLLSYAGRLENEQAQTWLSVFFFLWWVAGVIVLTFFGNYTTTVNANGYFGAWGAFVFSMFALINVSPRFQSRFDQAMLSVRKPLFILVVASAVFMGASIGPCSPSSACVGYQAYALVVGVISLFFSIILFLFPARLEKNLMRWIGLLFVIWWVFGTGVTTLGGPFKSTGNGYFSAYAALFASMMLFARLLRE